MTYSRDDYAVRLSPFAIMDGDKANHTMNIKLAYIYGLLASNSFHINYSDLQALEDREFRLLLLSHFELKQTLGMFGNLLAVVLGFGHLLIDAFDQFGFLLTIVHKDLVCQLSDTPMVGQHIKPVHILRSIQYICCNWFQYCKARDIT
jgi:hypothetical protein